MPTDEELLAHYEKYGYDVPFPKQGSGNIEQPVEEVDPLIAHYERYGYDVPFANHQPDLSQGMPQGLNIPQQGMMSDSGGMPAPMYQPQEPQKQQYPDIRGANSGAMSYLPPEQGRMDLAWMSLKNMFTGDENTKIDNIKQAFDKNFKGQGIDKDGNKFITLGKDSTGESQNFYVDAPNENMTNFLLDTNQFAFDTAVFLLGSRFLGGVGAKMGIGPAVGLTNILREGGKAGIIELGKESFASGDPIKATYDAGIEGLMSVAVDSAFRYLPMGIAKTITKLPFGVGDLAEKAQAKVGKMLYGGDPDLATALSFSNRDSISKNAVDELATDEWKTISKMNHREKMNYLKEKGASSVYRLTSGSAPIKKQAFADIVTDIFRNAPIPDKERRELVSNIYSNKSQMKMSYILLDDIRKFEEGLLEEMGQAMEPAQFEQLLGNDDLKNKMLETMFKSFDDAKVTNYYSNLWNSKKILENYTSRDWVEGMSTPNDVVQMLSGDVLMLSSPHKMIKLQAEIDASSAVNIEDYVKKYNSSLRREIIKREDELVKANKGNLKKIDYEDLSPLDINKIFKEKDASTKKLLDRINRVKMFGTTGIGIGGVMGGLDLGSTIGTGAMAYAGGELIEYMVAKQPKVFIQALKNLTERDAIVKNRITPEQLITMRKFKSTGDIKDFFRYLTQTYRRQSKVRQDLRQFTEEEEQSTK